MTKILMLLAQNDIDADPRVSRASQSAMHNGYDVKVCCYAQYSKSTYSKSVDRINMIFSNNVHTYKKSKPINENASVSVISVIATLIMLSIHPIDIFFKSKYFKPDIVHANDLNTLLSGVMYKTIYGCKLIYDSHEVCVDTLRGHPAIVIKLISAYERFLIHCADDVITVNNPIASELAARYHITTPHVVMNAPPLQVIHQSKHDGIRVIYQGRYTAGRYLETVVRGAQHFLPGVTLTMRGIGEYGETLKQYICSDNVEFVPPVSMGDLVLSLSGYDIGIATGANKQGKNGEFASPNKLFEYMMAGLAVVGDSSVVISSIIRKNNIGDVFDGCSPKDFARSINEIASDTITLHLLKQNSLKCVKEEYCWEIEQKKLFDVYRKCELL